MIDEKKLIEDIEKEFDGVCVYDVSPSQAVNDFVEIVDRQPKVGQWIPVSERLPRRNTEVLTYRTGMAMPILVDAYEGYYGEDDDEWHKGWRYGKESVIAWMPLPEPYEEENNG